MNGSPAAAATLAHAPSFRTRAWGHRSFAVGAGLTLLLDSAALLSFVWTPYSPYEMDLPGKLQPPDMSHWLGTDPF
nr:ABC transporter permease [Pseudomonadota bacterium]